MSLLIAGRKLMPGLAQPRDGPGKGSSGENIVYQEANRKGHEDRERDSHKDAAKDAEQLHPVHLHIGHQLFDGVGHVGGAAGARRLEAAIPGLLERLHWAAVDPPEGGVAVVAEGCQKSLVVISTARLVEQEADEGRRSRGASGGASNA